MTRAPRRYDVKRAEQLSADDRDAWREIVTSRPTLWSPYFQVEFFDEMAAISERVRVVVVRDAGAPIAFLPFQHVVMGFCQPVGGQICDTHGLIAKDAAEVDIERALEAAGMSFFTFNQIPADQSAFEPFARARYDCHAADLSRGYQAWFDTQSNGGTTKSFKTLARKTRNIERDHGPLRFELNDKSEAAFDKLLKWKSAQYRQSRYFDVFSARWTVELLRRLWALRSKRRLQGQLSSLYAGDTLQAVHFGMKGEHVVNFWFPAYDPNFAKYSAGNTLMDLMYRGWAEEGVRRVDLGGDETQFKLQFGGTRLPMMAGVVRRPTLTSQTYRAAGSLSDIVAKAPNRFIAKLPHRISSRIRDRLLYDLV